MSLLVISRTLIYVNSTFICLAHFLWHNKIRIHITIIIFLKYLWFAEHANKTELNWNVQCIVVSYHVCSAIECIQCIQLNFYLLSYYLCNFFLYKMISFSLFLSSFLIPFCFLLYSLMLSVWIFTYILSLANAKCFVYFLW